MLTTLNLYLFRSLTSWLTNLVSFFDFDMYSSLSFFSPTLPANMFSFLFLYILLVPLVLLQGLLTASIPLFYVLSLLFSVSFRHLFPFWTTTFSTRPFLLILRNLIHLIISLPFAHFFNNKEWNSREIVEIGHTKKRDSDYCRLGLYHCLQPCRKQKIDPRQEPFQFLS